MTTPTLRTYGKFIISLLEEWSDILQCCVYIIKTLKYNIMTYAFGEFLCCFRHSNPHRTTKYASGFRSSAPRTSSKCVSHEISY